MRRSSDQASGQIAEMFNKLRLAMTLIKLDLQKQKEVSSEFLIASLDQRTYFHTAKKVTGEIARRQEFNSNLSKLWLAMRQLAQEENEKRKEFNASKYFSNILFDDQQRELKRQIPLVEDSIMQTSWLEDTKVAPSMLTSLRSFVNEGTAFRSIDYQRTKLQSLLREVQSQMQSCKGLLIDLVRRTARHDQPEDQTKKELQKLNKIKNLEHFCREAVTMVKSSFQEVLTKGLSFET